MRGRKPKPAEQRKREGNAGKRPLPDTVLVSGRPDLAEVMEPPAHLSDDAQDFWRDSVKRLVEVGIIDRVDVPVLEQLCEQYARVRGAQRVIREVGMFARGSTGQIREHPALKIEREATSLFLKIAEHYALTPIARTRLGLAELHARTLAQELDGAGLAKPELKKVPRRKPKAKKADVEIVDAEVVAA
jgi:P27 family predicted phage terminase small subunit